MAKDASNVRVALTGSVWLGKSEDSTLPTSISESVDDTEWDDLGYTTADGVTFTFGKETEDIMGWQSTEVLRKLITSEPKSVGFTLRQLETATFLAAFGGTITEPDPTGAEGEFEWTPPAPGSQPIRPLIVEFDDDGIRYRWIFRRTSDTAEKEVTLMRTDAVNLPGTYEVLTAEPSWGKVQTDDPALAPSS